MTEFWKFVEDNEKVSPETLRLKYHGKRMPFDIDLAITQIECRRRFAVKLGVTLKNYPHWIFPSVLAGEQSTSDKAAEFHTSLINSGTSICDLTSGLGIDAAHFASRCSYVTAVEYEERKSRILAENISGAGITNLDTICADCREFINTSPRTYDTIFIDPARRAFDGSRLFSLSQCQPDVLSMLPAINRIAPRLIIKMSPMLDISQTLRELPSTHAIYAIGTNTECKELLADIRFDHPDIHPTINAVTLGLPNKTLSFTSQEENEAEYTLASSSRLSAYKYLLEPFPSIMKAAPYKILSQRYHIDQLHPNTHIYLSPTPPLNFPGDTYKILEIIPFESRHIKQIQRKYPQLQITTRNFPLSPEKLRSKLKTRDNGPLRLFGLTLQPSTPLMIITEPLSSSDSQQYIPYSQNNQ